MSRAPTSPSRRRAGDCRGEGAFVGGALPAPITFPSNPSRTPAQAPGRAERRLSGRAGRSLARRGHVLQSFRASCFPGPLLAAPRDRAAVRGVAVPICPSPTWGASHPARPAFSLEGSAWTS